MPDSAAHVPEATRHAGKQKLAVLRERLAAEAAAIRTARDWERYLRAAARLPEESFANILLVEAQRPGATMLRSYAEWQAEGRQVNRGEAGIEIFPASRQDNSVNRGKTSRAKQQQDHPFNWRDASHVTHVWDIAQTSGPPAVTQPPVLRLPDEVSPGLCDALRWLARREGYAVEREHGAPADGVIFWTPRRIRVLPGLNASQEAWALAHQLGHVLAQGALHHAPGVTTSGEACTGILKAEADAIAYITCARYGIPVPRYLDSPPAWAGTDPRAQPAAAILAAGERAVTAATRITRHLDQAVSGLAVATPRLAAETAVSQPEAVPAPPAPSPIAAPPKRDTRQQVILDEAAAVFSRQLPDSWGAAYVHSRGVTPATAREWHIGYATAGWTGLTGHLLSAGYAEEEIEAAGLARRSSRGTLIDLFRDRVMLPVRAADGRIAGFTGRARPGSPPGIPKYLNSPETSHYKKSDLLFGLHEAQGALGGGATPVLVEGPFDAIAVTTAGESRLAGVAPCGTALTQNQAALLASSCDLATTGVLVAFDDDPAGVKAAICAYRILRPLTANLLRPALAGRDPAQILEREGPRGLRAVLTAEASPLLRVIVDADLGRWDHRMSETEGPLLALRSAAAVLAGLLPAAATAEVRKATAGTELSAVNDEARPVVSPRVPLVAQALPADTASEAVRLASRLGFPVDEVVIEIANAVTGQAALRGSGRSATQTSLAASGFPAPPCAGPAAGTPPDHPRTATTRPAHSRGRRR